MKYIIFLTLLFTTFDVDAQYKKYKKKKVSYAKNTYFLYWGYNRSYYSKTDLVITASNYTITYKDALANDQPAPLNFKNYLSLHPVINPQYSFKAGYYFKEHWALTIGFDKFKYLLRNRSRVFKEGYIQTGPGIYDIEKFTSAEYIIDTAVINYENNGLNYLRLDLSRTTQWFRLQNKSKVAFSTDFAIGTGPIISNNTFAFNNQRNSNTTSISGMGVSLSIGNRLEFYERLFFQFNLSIGYIGQNRVNTVPTDAYSFSKQNFSYSSFNISLGMFLYGRAVNECGTCPGW
ncbi:MAG: hypothetical protein HYR91_06975 [Flavobacteriia bacterium]|nr:hypothetical protein [Flavobacteriia bacterium]